MLVSVCGPSKYIVALQLEASVDSEGALTVRASQGGRAATAFDRSIAGNPTGRGVPHSALGPTLRSQGKSSRGVRTCTSTCHDDL